MKTADAMLHFNGFPPQESIRIKVPVRDGDIPDIVRYGETVFHHDIEDFRHGPFHYFEVDWVYDVAAPGESG